MKLKEILYPSFDSDYFVQVNLVDGNTLEVIMSYNEAESEVVPDVILENIEEEINYMTIGTYYEESINANLPCLICEVLV